MNTPRALAGLSSTLFILCLATPLMSGPAAADVDSDAPSVLVQTVMAVQGSLSRTITVYGTVQAAVSARATVAAPLSASVETMDVRPGETLAPGAVLMRLVPSPQMTASYTQAVSALQVAGESLDHVRELLDQHLATRQQLADAQKARSDAQAALTALKAQGAGGPTTLRAPYRAIVMAIFVDTHALVTEGTALIELVRPTGLVLATGVVPDQAATILTGARATVTPTGSTRNYAGTVTFRGSIVDSTTGLVSVQVALPPDGFLPGETAQAVIGVGTARGYIVPHPAILVDERGSDYVVQDVDGIARIVHVRVLATQADSDTIDGPLQAKAPVVLAGNYQAREGMKLRLTSTAHDNGP